ncbi:hypothetical protein KP509_16G022600 [Ceratopteris richardii]|uniref:Uncharacterized protein n=1 Tax=Ceratopteris richardii TaxID=49495 RepID=A0A8T2T2V9_CERRI|nr:hypothetical protein KP509_16G022600 [Ceratopteris richardii]
MVRVKCLQRYQIPPVVLRSPSPASINSNRVAVHASHNSLCRIFFASGIHVYQAKFDLKDEMIVQGKDSLVIPTEIQMVEVNKLELSPHRSEIQSVSISESECDNNILLGTADSYGRIVISHVGLMDEGSMFSASPRNTGTGEGGWAGLAFVPSQPSLIIVARGPAKSIDLYDKDLHVRTMHTLQYPTDLALLETNRPGSGMDSIVAITEGAQISIWDLRAHENGGCIQRILGSSTMEPLYAVCGSPDSNLLGAGGAERTAMIIDKRKWMVLSRWTNCLKYEITGVSFSAFDSNSIYVHGLDYEVICGKWHNGLADHERKHFAFRGDSRWLGLSKSVNSDILAGWCESGSIFAGEAVYDAHDNSIANGTAANGWID